MSTQNSQKEQSKFMEGLTAFLRDPELAKNAGKLFGHLVQNSSSQVDNEVLDGLKRFTQAASAVSTPLEESEQITILVDTIKLATSKTENTIDDSISLLLPTIFSGFGKKK